MSKINDFTRDELERIKAIELYELQRPIKAICSELRKSRRWFYKWLKRYNSLDINWFKSISRAPLLVHNKIPEVKEKEIIKIRNDLTKKRFSQIGAQTIHYELLRKGLNPPAISTINNVLKRNNLIIKKDSKNYIKKGKIYPYDYSLCHEMDFVGPRYLSGGIRYYFLNIIDKETHCVDIHVQITKDSISTCNSLITSWQKMGIPDYLQMDNELCFLGSLRHTGAFGRIIKLCVKLEVTPVFIPQAEPWRNGVIEHFNNLMQKKLILEDRYDSIKKLEKSIEEFIAYHNNEYHYSTQQGMTPVQAMNRFGYPLCELDKKLNLNDTQESPLEGEVHIVRFIRSDLKFNFMNRSFRLPENTKYEYVLGKLILHEHRLVIYKDNEKVKEFEFIVFNNCARSACTYSN